MTKLVEGMIVKTNYGTGPYLVINCSELCRCPNYHDSINMKDPPQSKEHYHYVCCDPSDKRDLYYLNGFDEKNQSVWSDDRIIIISQKGAQLKLF